jgi:hypothetical protein
MGTIASSPSTPVVATPIGSVPLYDVPIIPTLPVVQVAKTSSLEVGLVKPLARPFSQSITAFGPSVSNGSPVVGQPSERPVPVPSACTTANPRGTHVPVCELLMMGLVSKKSGSVTGLEAGGWPISWSTSQLTTSTDPP